MSLPVYFAFLLACAVVMIGPSPALTLIVASRPRHGRRPIRKQSPNNLQSRLIARESV
jgi:threonine/homoserine/homoserine lactone efflux protein